MLAKREGVPVPPRGPHNLAVQRLIELARPPMSSPNTINLLHGSFRYGIRSSHHVNASWTSISIIGPVYLDAAIADAEDVVGVMVILSFLFIGETQ